MTAYEKTYKAFSSFFAFDLGEAFLDFWEDQPKAARAAFFGACVIGFVSHIFVYTGRFFGRDDMGIIRRTEPMVGTGRWFTTVITNLSYGYVLPLVSGVFVTFFLAVSAFYVCKLFNVQKTLNAVLIAGLMSTFPSIANTNLFLYDTSNYHFGAMLAVLAVYATVKYRYGFFLGAFFSMLVLAIFQSKFNIVLTLCVLHLICELLEEKKDFGIILRKWIPKFTALLGFGAILYIVSLPISFLIHEATFNEYRGFSPGSMAERLLSVHGFTSALENTYQNYFAGFFGNIYLIVDTLRHVYVVLMMFGILLLYAVVAEKKLYVQNLRLILTVLLVALIPLASNFSNFFDTYDAYGLMIYAFVFTPVFVIVLTERTKYFFPVAKSLISVLMVVVIANYIIGNNVFYLRAHFVNQRTHSFTIRLLNRIDPLLVYTNQITFFGGLPNESYTLYSGFAYEHKNIRDGSALTRNVFLNMSYPYHYFSLLQFAANIRNNHGVYVHFLGFGEKREQIEELMREKNMPVWPREGSIAIVEGVIVVNFGLD